jgi:glycosyltransferase involved in cell wall biosynthesis
MSSFEPGGTERQMIELIRRLDRVRWRVEVACLRAGGGWFDRVASVAPITVFPLTSLRRISVVRHLTAFARWCRDRRIAVVHTTDLPSNIFALPGAAIAGVPVRVASRRELVAGRSLAEIGLQRAAYTCAHRVVANCRAAADRLLRERVAPHKIAIVKNGLDLPDDRPPRARDLRRVVVVANLRPEKGHDVLIDAASEVLRRFPDARFELVGGGAERAALAARATERGVAHAFTFLGHRDDVPERLATADMFVLPSRSEAFPNALLEAMAAGLPVVASSVGGVLELVENGRNGFLVPAGNAFALADRICRLMADPSLGRRLGVAARADVEARYSFDRMVTAFENVYLGELTRRGIIGVARPELATS